LGIGWRFVNKLMKERFGVDSMPDTAKNIAVDFRVERDKHPHGAGLQRKAIAAQRSRFFAREIAPVTVSQRKDEAIVVAQDEHPRETSLEALARLKGVV
jgi:acetyl-CoA acetyltransferase